MSFWDTILFMPKIQPKNCIQNLMDTKMNKLIKFFVAVLLTVFIWNCHNFVDVPGDGNNPSGYKSIIVTDIAPDSLQLTPFVLNKATITRDTLTLNISYGGGCEVHDFDLYMSPAAFMESYPVQANIYIKHNGNGDVCKAYITKDISFDISKIAENYRNSYFSRAGTVILNVFEYYEGSPSKTIPVNYSFL